LHLLGLYLHELQARHFDQSHVPARPDADVGSGLVPARRSPISQKIYVRVLARGLYLSIELCLSGAFCRWFFQNDHK